MRWHKNQMPRPWKSRLIGSSVSESGDSVDVGSIQAVENSVTFWEMGNLFGPIGEGIVSVKSYNLGDCKNFLVKTLKTSFHKEPMAGDSVEAQASDNSTWKKPPLNSASANILKFVCGR